MSQLDGASGIDGLRCGRTTGPSGKPRAAGSTSRASGRQTNRTPKLGAAQIGMVTLLGELERGDRVVMHRNSSRVCEWVVGARSTLRSKEAPAHREDDVFLAVLPGVGPTTSTRTRIPRPCALAAEMDVRPDTAGP